MDKEFGSCERFKKVFSQTAIRTEDSGWAALSFYKKTGRHYKNDKGKFVEEFWSSVNWTLVNKRLEDLLQS